MLETEKFKEGPIYIRLGRGGDKIITKKTSKIKIGKAVEIVNQKENLFITTGVTTQIALEAIKTLEKDKINVGLVHFNAIRKPLDKQFLKKLLKQLKCVITVEEHSIIEVGSSILEFMNENKIYDTKVKRI